MRSRRVLATTTGVGAADRKPETDRQRDGRTDEQTVGRKPSDAFNFVVAVAGADDEDALPS